MVSYEDLEAVEQRGRVRQAAELKLGGVVLGHVAVGPGTQVHLLDVAEERVAQVLHGVYHDPAVDGVA